MLMEGVLDRDVESTSLGSLSHKQTVLITNANQVLNTHRLSATFSITASRSSI